MKRTILVHNKVINTEIREQNIKYSNCKYDKKITSKPLGIKSTK